MKKEKTRVEKALDKVLEHLEVIIDYRIAPNFVKITYRVYNDDFIYER